MWWRPSSTGAKARRPTFQLLQFLRNWDSKYLSGKVGAVMAEKYLNYWRYSSPFLLTLFFRKGKRDGDSGTFPAQKPKVGTVVSPEPAASAAIAIATRLRLPEEQRQLLYQQQREKVNFPLKTELMASREKNFLCFWTFAAFLGSWYKVYFLYIILLYDFWLYLTHRRAAYFHRSGLDWFGGFSFRAV